MKDYLQIIKDHTPDIIGNTRMFYGAVVIPLIETKDGYDVLFEVRSSKIEAQPGDICLPGGAMEGEEQHLKLRSGKHAKNFLSNRNRSRSSVHPIYSGKIE
jgi:8-oxo-dGTP pyrophosphatase MutT (NUDIX family)